MAINTVALSGAGLDVRLPSRRPCRGLVKLLSSSLVNCKRCHLPLELALLRYCPYYLGNLSPPTALVE